MPLIQDLPRIDSPRAALRWLRLLGRALGRSVAFLGWPWSRPWPSPLAAPAETVILVTLDGVRPKELLSHPSAMPYLMQHLLPLGSFVGSDSDRPDMQIGSPIGISMSGYHSIFSGRLTACFDNEDRTPSGSSLVSRLEAAFPNEVALLASWPLLIERLRFDPAKTDTVAGHEAALTRLGTKSAAHFDAPILQVALDLLSKTPPRFLYIGLDETDTAAHSGSFARYLDTLARFDAYLRDLAEAVAALQARGRRVVLMVTTDHGRGMGEEWVEHRWNIAGTDRAWLFVMGHGIAARGRVQLSRRYTQYDIRPTVEYLLGLPDERRPWRGAVMEETLA